jgi:hypothetical protein
MRIMGRGRFSHCVSCIVEFKDHVAAGTTAAGAGEVEVDVAGRA